MNTEYHIITYVVNITVEVNIMLICFTIFPILKTLNPLTWNILSKMRHLHLDILCDISVYTFQIILFPCILIFNISSDGGPQAVV